MRNPMLIFCYGNDHWYIGKGKCCTDGGVGSFYKVDSSADQPPVAGWTVSVCTARSAAPAPNVQVL